jgi:DNA-binding response OmpR family regulator
LPPARPLPCITLTAAALITINAQRELRLTSTPRLAKNCKVGQPTPPLIRENTHMQPFADASRGDATDAAAPMQVLLVDDDRELCRMLEEYLGPEGFRLTIVHDGDAALYQLGRHHFDLIVLDVMLPRMGGLDVLRLLRQKLTTPVLMLTARGEEIDRVVGLELGADDYLPKPFNPRELVARMRAILRRSLQLEPQPGRRERIEAGPVSLHLASRTASARGQSINLTGVEFRVLEVLMQQVGTVVSREQLTRQVLGRRLTPYDRSIDTHISNIRRKLAVVADSISIVNVRRSGYVLTVAEANAVQSGGSSAQSGGPQAPQSGGSAPPPGASTAQPSAELGRVGDSTHPS